MEAQSTQPTYSGMLRNLQGFWEEIGENDTERDAQLLQLEARCFAIYEEAVAVARKRRDDLQEFIVRATAELQTFHGCLGEDHLPVDTNQGTLLEVVATLEPRLGVLKERVEQRRMEFQAVRGNIKRLAIELGEPPLASGYSENDLTNQHLSVLKEHQHALGELKRARLEMVMEHVTAAQQLCAVMSLSLKETLSHVHESLCDPVDKEAANVAQETLVKLGQTVDNLRDEKRRRIQKLSNLGATMLQLCDLMEIPAEAQSAFLDVTRNIGASENGVFHDGDLSSERLAAAEAEVKRLEGEKIIKLKDLVFKKRIKVEEICAAAHMVPPADSAPEQLECIIEEGLVDAADLLGRMEEQVALVTEEKVSRREILEAVERWQKARAEETWLDEFEQDNNRYAPQRGQHLILQRAESARKELRRLPDLVKATMGKVKAWEETRRQEFLYDGERLIELLNEDAVNRTQREQEKKRHLEATREEKKRAAEEEAKYGAHPHPRSAIKGATPNRRPSTLRPNGAATPGDRRMSMAPNQGTPQASPDRRMSMGPVPPPTSASRVRVPSTLKREKNRPAVPLNVVSIVRDSPLGRGEGEGRENGRYQQQRLPLSPRQANLTPPAGSNWDNAAKKGSSLKAVEGENLQPRYLEY